MVDEVIYTKEGRSLIKTVVENRVARYELRFLRQQKKRIKAKLDEVQALIDKALELQVEEDTPETPIP